VQCCSHGRIKKSGRCFLTRAAKLSQLVAGKRHYPVKRFNKRNIGDLVTAGIEQFSKRPVISLYPLLVRQKS
jgi:hypothetical protein